LDAIAELTPLGRYRRHIDGADFSLEANTDAVPEKGHFYVLRKGKVVMQSDDFPSAVEAYQDLCRTYWQNHLGSDDAEERLASAWGLISLEPENPAAAEVIRHDGDPADRKRLEQIRNRKRYGRAHAGRGRGRQGARAG
jgi:hypothetical protein